MGNGSSGPRMAISAMADMLKITRQQMLQLRNVCLRYAKPKPTSHDRSNAGGLFISRSSLNKAMEEIKLDPLDIDVIGHLFTMWDTKGEDNVNLLIFLAGISPLASTMDVTTKLRFALEVFDVHQTGKISFDEALSILGGINATASYFGDSVITPQSIENVVETIFKHQDEIKYLPHIQSFVDHPFIVQFCTANGTMRYGGSNRMDP
jgi:Ca2+-binding protein (EF-Hand superfamily)